MKENFIPTIANFSTEDITDESRAKMKRDYMSQKEYVILKLLITLVKLVDH